MISENGYQITSLFYVRRSHSGDRACSDLWRPRCVGGKKGNSNEDQTTAQSNQENDPSSPANDGETDEKKDASPAADTDAETTMEKPARK